MKYVKAKNESDVKLEGVDVSFTVVDGAIKSVDITDTNGKSIRIVKAEAYSETLSILVEEAVEYETTYSTQVLQEDGGVTIYTLKSKEDVLDFERKAGHAVKWDAKETPIKKDALSGQVINNDDFIF